MIQLGAFHELEVVAEESVGLRLGEDRIVLPRKLVPEGAKVGDRLKVFVYEGSDGRPVATTKTPKAQVGSFGYLRVVDRSPHGAFVNWGLEKDLLVPQSEQHRPMQVGRSYVIAVCTDAQERVMGSTKIREFVDDDTSKLRVGQEVDALVWETHERGLRVIVDQRWEGMIFHDDIYGSLGVGDSTRARIIKIRRDGKLDLSLRAQGEAGRGASRDDLEAALREAGGFLPLHDKSPPGQIERKLSMSKKAFKRAVGNLLKAGKLEKVDGGIRLIDVAD